MRRIGVRGRRAVPAVGAHRYPRIGELGSLAALVGGSAMVSKVYFSRMLLPLAIVVPSLIDFCTSLAMMGILMGGYSVAPTAPLCSCLPGLFSLSPCQLGWRS